MPSSSPPVLEFVVSVVLLLRLVRLFCLGNGRFEAGITQNFLAGLCPAPRWGCPPQTRPGASRPRPRNPSLDAPPRQPGPPVTPPGVLHAALIPRLHVY